VKELFKKKEHKNDKKRGSKKPIKATEMQLALAALGVIEDNLTDAAPIDDIIFSLRIDFQHRMKEMHLGNLLSQASSIGYVIESEKGWRLTPAGEKYVDGFLDVYQTPH
jgi:hypothetical protein